MIIDVFRNKKFYQKFQQLVHLVKTWNETTVIVLPFLKTSWPFSLILFTFAPKLFGFLMLLCKNSFENVSRLNSDENSDWLLGVPVLRESTVAPMLTYITDLFVWSSCLSQKLLHWTITFPKSAGFLTRVEKRDISSVK